MHRAIGPAPTAFATSAGQGGTPAALAARGAVKAWKLAHLWTGSDLRAISPAKNPHQSAQDRARNLEAVLLLSQHGISSRRAAKLAGLADATEVRTLIRQLNLVYDQQAKPYRIEEVAGGYAILTREHFAPWLRKLVYLPGEVKLSQSAMETLAVVAYRQPVMRADVEAVRGMGCSEMLKQLMDLDLVRISGRSEDLGRPYLYSTTQRFLQMFGLRSADRLPRMEWVNSLLPNHYNSSPADTAVEAENKESTVKKTLAASTLVIDEEIVGQRLLDAAATSRIVERASDDDDDFEDDDDEEFDDEEDEDDDDEDFEEWEDEEDEDEDLEEGDEEDSEDEEWEEVDDQDSEEDEDDDDDDWDDEDDEDDDDWEDEDDDEEEEDWE